MDLNGQVVAETEGLAEASELTYEAEVAGEAIEQQDQQVDAVERPYFDASGLGIAAVLFPANPPQAANARLIRGLSFHDDSKKPRGLAGAAGLFERTWEETENHAVSAVDPFSRNWS